MLLPQNPLWRHIQRYTETAVMFPATRPDQLDVAVSTNQPIVQATLPQPDVADALAIPDTALPSPRVSTPAPIPTAPIVMKSIPAPIQAKADELASDERANWRQLQAIVANHRAKQAAEGETSSSDPYLDDLAQTEAPSYTSTAKQTADTPPIQRAPAPSATRPPANSPRPELHPLPQDSSLSTSSPEAKIPQPTPLENVWPVQRIKSSTAIPSPQPAVGTPTAPPLTKAQEQAVQTTLKKVEPEKPTDSDVDFNPPRRPRPTAKSPTTVQRQSRPPVSAPEMVPTEIGLLPADLWQLLDQEPPTSSGSFIPGAGTKTAVQPPTSLATPPASLSKREPLPSPVINTSPLGDEANDLPNIDQLKEDSKKSQKMVPRQLDDRATALELNLPNMGQILEQVPNAVSENAPPSMPTSAQEMVAGREQLPLSPTEVAQSIPTSAQPELPSLPISLPTELPTQPNMAQSFSQVPSLAQMNLPDNLSIPSMTDLPENLSSALAVQQIQQEIQAPASDFPVSSITNGPTMPEIPSSISSLQPIAQSSLTNTLPTTPDIPNLPATTPAMPSLSEATAVDNNIPNSLNDLSNPEVLLGLDSGNEETNIDDIARQVYRHLKRRLDVEWERTRSRR